MTARGPDESGISLFLCSSMRGTHLPPGCEAEFLDLDGEVRLRSCRTSGRPGSLPTRLWASRRTRRDYAAVWDLAERGRPLSSSIVSRAKRLGGCFDRAQLFLQRCPRCV